MNYRIIKISRKSSGITFRGEFLAGDSDWRPITGELDSAAAVMDSIARHYDLLNRPVETILDEFEL